MERRPLTSIGIQGNWEIWSILVWLQWSQPLYLQRMRLGDANPYPQVWVIWVCQGGC